MTDKKRRPTVIICKDFQFSAAHSLPEYDGDCANIHGHTWKLKVCFKAQMQPDGMAVDFKDIKYYISQIIKRLDHKYLNDTINNPTAEFICHWLWSQLLEFVDSFRVANHRSDFKLYKIILWESDTSSIEYQGGL